MKKIISILIAVIIIILLAIFGITHSFKTSNHSDKVIVQHNSHKGSITESKSSRSTLTSTETMRTTSSSEELSDPTSSESSSMISTPVVSESNISSVTSPSETNNPVIHNADEAVQLQMKLLAAQGADNSDLMYDGFDNGDGSFQIIVHSKSLQQAGGSGTVGVYTVTSDGQSTLN